MPGLQEEAWTDRDPVQVRALFCAAHIHDHGCTYDYKAEAVAELWRNNPVISPPKVTKF